MSREQRDREERLRDMIVDAIATGMQGTFTVEPYNRTAVYLQYEGRGYVFKVEEYHPVRHTGIGA